MSRRRWYLRLLLVPLVAIVAAFLTTVIWFVVAYEQLAGDLESSRERLPNSIAEAVVPAGDIVDEDQVTLAMGSAGKREGTAVVALRSDPDRRQLVLLSLPTILEETDDAALIRSVSRMLGTGVNHVMVVTPRSLGEIVEAVGPIQIANPSPVDRVLESGRYLHFPAGEIVLDGPRTLAFMEGTGETTTVAREQLVLEGIIGTLLTPTTVSELAEATQSMANSANTDLTPSDLVGLAWLRFHSDTLIRCRATESAEATGSVPAGQRSLFLGETTLEGETVGGCRSRSLEESSFPLPPKIVIKAVEVAYPFWRVALVALAGGLLLLLVFFLRSRLWSSLRGLSRRLSPARLWHATAAGITHLRSLGQRPGSAGVDRRSLTSRVATAASCLHPGRIRYLVRGRPTSWVTPRRRTLRERVWTERGRGAPEWANIRGDLGLYLLVMALAAAIMFLILLSVA